MQNLLLAAVITFAPCRIPALASNLTGEDLAYACEANLPDIKKGKQSVERAQLCNAYSNGWDDARFAFLQGARTFCPPGITVKEMSVIFFDYLASHNEARRLPAAEAIMAAFKNKLPCNDASTSTLASEVTECYSSTVSRLWSVRGEVMKEQKIAPTCVAETKYADGSYVHLSKDIDENVYFLWIHNTEWNLAEKEIAIRLDFSNQKEQLSYALCSPSASMRQTEGLH